MWNSVFVSLATGRTSRSCLTAGPPGAIKIWRQLHNKTDKGS
jgi:hypothetical protein